MTTERQKILFIALSKVPKVGPVIAKNLISYCGSIEAVFDESKTALSKIPGIGQSFVDQFLPSDYISAAEEEFEHTRKNNISVLTYLDKDYPQRLLNFDYSPIVIYFQGNCNLNHYRNVAIVGTRSPSNYGVSMCEQIVEGLSRYNVLIVSGLAYGIDSTAHRKSVELEIPTLGILGNGLPSVYPQSHDSLSKKMIKKGGILTEFTSDTKPDRENFPMRNRIIAAISDVVIVVESKSSGGSIITANFANDYNKDVFAVPGKITDETSQGCNKLIKQNKAHLIESIDDISYIMRWDEVDAGKIIQKELFVELDDDEQRAINTIKELENATIDAITYRLKMQPSKVSALLLNLEFKGMIKTLPGKKYTII